MFKEQHELVMTMNPNVSTFYSGSRAMKTYLLWLCGCLFCCPLKGDMLMTPHATRAQQSKMKTMLAARGRKGCLTNFLIWVFRRVHKSSKGLFRHLKARGNGTVIWVVNDPVDFNELHD